MAGTVLGIYYKTSNEEVIKYSIQSISLLAAVVLTFFIVKAFIQMINPLYGIILPTINRTISTSNQNNRSKVLRENRISIVIIVGGFKKPVSVQLFAQCSFTSNLSLFACEY